MCWVAVVMVLRVVAAAVKATGYTSDTEAAPKSEPQSIGFRGLPNSVQMGLLMWPSEATRITGSGARAGDGKIQALTGGDSPRFRGSYSGRKAPPTGPRGSRRRSARRRGALGGAAPREAGVNPGSSSTNPPNARKEIALSSTKLRK